MRKDIIGIGIAVIVAATTCVVAFARKGKKKSPKEDNGQEVVVEQVEQPK